MDQKGIEELRNQLLNLKEKNSKLETHLRNLLDEKDRMNETLEEYRLMLQKLEEKLQSDSDIHVVNQLRENNSKLETQIDTLNNVIEGLQEENENLKNKLKEIKTS